MHTHKRSLLEQITVLSLSFIARIVVRSKFVFVALSSSSLHSSSFFFSDDDLITMSGGGGGGWISQKEEQTHHIPGREKSRDRS